MLDRVLQWVRGVRGPLTVLVSLVVIIAILALTDDAGRAMLSVDRTAVIEGEIWRLLTGHLVHLTRAHAFMNILGLILIFVVLWEAMDARGLIRVCVVSALTISLGILFLSPDVGNYVGWSGITHGVFAWGGLRMLSVRRWFGVLIVATVAFKIGWETVMGPTPGASDAIGGFILLESHLFGAVGGVITWIWERAAPGRMVAMLAVLSAACLGVGQPQAHSPEERIARLALNADGALELTIEIEVAAFVLREPPGPLTGATIQRIADMPDAELQDYIDGAGAYLMSTVRLIASDGRTIAPDRIRMPTAETLRRHVMDAGASTPSGALLLVFRAQDVTGLIQPQLRLPPLLGPLFFFTTTADGAEKMEILPPGVPSQPVSLIPPASFWTIVGEGIQSVLPDGGDHAVFVALLAIALPSVVTCLGYAVAFALGQSITLFAAGLGWITVPQTLVETGIALTMMFMGVGTLIGLRKAPGMQDLAVQPKREAATVAFFGGLHGLGLAGVFAGLPLSGAMGLADLLAFNIGIEIAQLLAILTTLALLYVIARAISVRRAWHLRLGLSAGVALTGAFWTVQRLVALTG